MAEFPALPLFTDAYLADTRHLTTLEHGAYILLLMEAWRRPRCSLPDDDNLLCRLAGVSPEEWQGMKPIVMGFWQLNKKTREWTQKRLQKERRFVRKKSGVQRERAISRWKEKKKQDAVALPEGCRSDAPTPTPTPTPTIIIESPNGDSAPARASPKKGSRLAGDWTLPDDWRAEAQAMAAGRPLDVSTEAARFRDYWVSVAGQRGVKLDWRATWRNWIRTTLERLPGVPSDEAPTRSAAEIRAEIMASRRLQ